MQGTYIGGTKSIDQTIQLVFKNNRFYYMYDEGLLRHVSFGKWSRNKNIIHLNSDDSLTAKNGKVIEEYRMGNTFNIIQLSNPGGQISNIPFQINYKETLYTDSDGVIKTYFSIDTFFTNFYADYQFFYQKKNNLTNYFLVTLFPSDNSQIHFVNKKYVHKGNMLLDEEGNYKLKKTKRKR